jgi:hypothetical protein
MIWSNPLLLSLWTRSQVCNHWPSTSSNSVFDFSIQFIVCGHALLLFLVEIMHEPKLYPPLHDRTLSTAGF